MVVASSDIRILTQEASFLVKILISYFKIIQVRREKIGKILVTVTYRLWVLSRPIPAVTTNIFCKVTMW